MGVMNQAAIDKVAKELYPQKSIIRSIIEDSAFMGLVDRRTDFKGKYQVVGLRYALPSGRSATLSRAIANADPSALEAYRVTRVKDYAVAGIDTETIRSADGDVGALIDALDFELGGALEALKRSIATSLFRNRGGSIGRLDSAATTAAGGTTSNTGPFVLTNPEDIVHFERGMVINLATTDGTSGSVKAGTAEILSVDRQAGSFRTVAAINSITSPALTDFVFADGDFGLKLAGLDSWLPLTAPAPGDNFFSVDRSNDPERLAGVRCPAGNGGPIEQTLLRAVGYMARNGGSRPDCVFLNNQDWMSLVVSMGDRKMLTNVESTVPELGYEALRLAGPKGDLKVLADANCPSGRAYILQMDTWKFWTLGDIGFIMEDNLRMLRDSTEDSYTWRLGYYGNLVCHAPGFNGVVTL
jgi:hypothetical protein